MAVTPVGNPYVESSDLVANYPGASEALAERIDIVGVNPFADAAARDAAIPSPVQGQMCSLNDDNKGYRYDGSAWVLFSGAGDANFTNAATGTYTDGGINYKYITFTGSGELIVDQAGFADILVIAGGGGGAANLSGGGGAGGYLSLTSVYLTVGSHTAVVGGGGASGANGNASTLFNYYALPGGSAGSNTGTIPPNDFLTLVCGSGGGGGAISVANAAGGAGLSGQGFAGGLGNVNNTGTGGGGGASAVGADFPAATAGGAGGAGTSSSITGSAVTRAGGGGGSGQAGGGGAGGAGGGGAGSTTSGNAVSGTANTGSGGGGTHTGTVGLGGSGVVIIRVVV